MEEFEAVYRRHFEGVYRYVLSLCGSAAVAEEITQEAFYRAMEHMDRFRGKCSLFVWLCQIAKNTYFTYAKKQSRQVSEADAALAQQAEPGPEGALLDRETAGQLHKALHGLPDPYKEVFSLRVFGELPFSQIGELFGKSDSWARLIYFRAKKALRRELDEAIV